MSNATFQQTFGKEPEFTAFAPGRIEFLGNHTDYNGGSVLGAAIDRGITASIAGSDSASIELFSTWNNATVSLSLDDISKREGDERWANYIIGVLDQLIRAGANPTHGFQLFIDSNLPAGAGLGSSAALELAACMVIKSLYQFSLERKGMALLCQRVEHDFVGVPCGILDQGVSAFGKENALVGIDCREIFFDIINIPPGVAFWIFDTGVTHEQLDSLYLQRHEECTEAYELLLTTGAEAAYLAHIDPTYIREHEAMIGEELYKRALHVVEENNRVLLAHKRLADGDLTSVGKLLNASHDSSKRLFENSTEELDFLVKCLQPLDNVYGARLTGRGFGGTVMAMTNLRFKEEDARSTVCLPYAEKFGKEPSLIKVTTANGAHLL